MEKKKSFKSKWVAVIYVLAMVGFIGLPGCSVNRKPPPRPAGSSPTSRVATRLSNPAHLAKWTNSLGMTFVYLKGGTFQMGSPTSEKGRNSNETQHSVTLTKGFWLGRTEVTQAQWQAVMASNPSDFKGDAHPVDSVSWDDAMEFCRKLSDNEGRAYTLPTEAQWEYACRAGSSDTYYFGNDPNQFRDYAWYRANSDNTTHPVGTRKKNAFDLYDMHGNVWEWCADWYDSDFYNRDINTDPLNENHGDRKYRICRGGSFAGHQLSCRDAMRAWAAPGESYNGMGFRVCLPDL